MPRQRAGIVPAAAAQLLLLLLVVAGSDAFLLMARPPATTGTRGAPLFMHHDPIAETAPVVSDSPTVLRIASALSRSAAVAVTTAALALLPPPLPATAAPTATTTTTTNNNNNNNFLPLLAASESSSAANLPDDVLAVALVSLSKGASLDRLTAPAAEGLTPPSPALYITARVGQRGRVLASVRVPLADLPNGGFPAEIQVRTGDVYADTPEAREEVARSIRTSDLVLSARLDRDGQAATRDPEDLVGQGTVYKFQSSDSAQWSRATLELGGRGAFGELVTGKRK